MRHVLFAACLLALVGLPAQATQQPLEPLMRFSAKPLERAIDPTVAKVFDWFWRWHDSLQKAHGEPLHLGGGVVIDGKPCDFTLDVHQQESNQVYSLSIETFGKVKLIVKPTEEGRQELEFELEREGQSRVRGGHLMLEQ